VGPSTKPQKWAMLTHNT